MSDPPCQMVKWVDQMFKLNAQKTKLTLQSACWFSTGRNWIVRLMNLNDKSVKIAGKTYFIETIITAHHLFWGHCVKSEVIVLDRGIFLSERSSRRKIPRSKTITDEFTQWPKQRWWKVIIVINNRYFDNFVHFICIFLTKTRRKQYFYHFYTHPCKRIWISPDVTIIARCDKWANTGCIARDCLCVYAYARMALAIIPTSHAEVIIRSHC